MELKQKIDYETCIACGFCVEVCPMSIMSLKKEGDKQKVVFDTLRSQYCITCGHCMAICSTKSFQVEGISYENDLFELSKEKIETNTIISFLESRRSIRLFKKTPVPRELLEKIVNTITLAPMSFPPHKVEVTVVSKRDIIEKSLPIIEEVYDKLDKQMSNPMIRFFIKREIKIDVFNTLRTHVLPTMKFKLSHENNGKEDRITRGAPTMLLFHANRESCSHSEDVLITLTYGLIAAHALGLGATAIGLVPPAVERTKELRELFQIPKENEVLASMIVGYPKLHFKRGIKRQLPKVTWL